MRTALAALLLCAAAPVFANPMLDKCLPFAPLACGLTDQSPGEQFLACFETVRLDPKKADEAACAEELAHARVHKACDADIAALCAKVKPGGNRTMSCLHKNVKKASPDCGKALKAYDDVVAPQTKGRKHGRGSAISAVRC